MLPLKFFVLFLPGIGTVIFGELGHRIALGWILNQYKTDFWPLPLYSGPNSFFQHIISLRIIFYSLKQPVPVFYAIHNITTIIQTLLESVLLKKVDGVHVNHIALQNVNILYHHNCFINVILVPLFCFCSGSFTKLTVLVRICHL